MHSQIQKRICKSPPSSFVAHKTTPVVSFGNFEIAEIGTLGINPSPREFFSKSLLLDSSQKRLADLESLELRSHDQIDEFKAQEILDGCYNYFKLRPLDWFSHFSDLFNHKGYSYEDGTASHFDLVQWCTIPKWSDIPRTEQEKLLKSDEEFFHWQLENNNMRTIILGGRQVLEQVKRIPSVSLETMGKYFYMSGARKTSYELYKMRNFRGRKLIGWSVNLQVVKATPQEKATVVKVLKQFLEDEL